MEQLNSYFKRRFPNPNHTVPPWRRFRRGRDHHHFIFFLRHLNPELSMPYQTKSSTQSPNLVRPFKITTTSSKFLCSWIFRLPHDWPSISRPPSSAQPESYRRGDPSPPFAKLP
ncbi:unnamed protein product [Cuscuta europaea]|uniref:Uncharacterized protein n=1 Tax=Cuscuta europaea TaxID=41803 RepID=A0A9P0YQE3_CUSEU|nr:unnamed protein product [Cuscuta europaea]